MAEHNLKLKAVLDTSQVRQQIEQLNRARDAALTGGGAGAAAGKGAAGFSGAGISSALARLNVSISRLNTAITKLSSGVLKMGSGASRMPMTGSTTGRSAVFPGATAKAFSGGSNPIMDKRAADYLRKHGMSRELYGRYAAGEFNNARDAYLHSALDKHLKPFKRQFEYGNKVYNDALSRYLASGRSAGLRDPSILAEGRNLASFYQNQSYRDASQFMAMQKRNNQFNRMVRMGVGTWLMGDVGHAAVQYGQETGASWTGGANLLTNVGSNAAMGAMIGGPWGALIGAGAGLLQSAFQELTDSARSAADAVKAWDKGITAGQAFDKKFSAFKENNIFRDFFDYAVDNDKIEDLKAVAKAKNSRAIELQEKLSNMYGMGSYESYESLAEKAKKNQQQIEDIKSKTGQRGPGVQRGASHFIPQDELNQLYATQKALEAENERIKKALDSMADDYDELNRIKQEQIQIENAIKAALKQKEAAEKAAAAKAEAQAKMIERMNQHIMGSWIALTQQDRARKSGQIASGLNSNKVIAPWEDGPTEDQIDEDWIKSFAQYRNFQDEAEKLRKQYEAILKQAQNEMDPDKKQALMDQASKLHGQYQFALGQQDSWKGQMQNADMTKLNMLTEKLNGLVKPDLSPVQSMASMGANMGEKNDNVQRMQNFWNEQISLQREIKDLVNEINQNYNGTGATYQ